MFAQKKFKVRNTEDALRLFDKDSTNKYNHYFYKSRSNLKCRLCYGLIDEHLSSHEELSEIKNEPYRFKQAVRRLSKTLVDISNLPKEVIDYYEDDLCSICYVNKLNTQNEVKFDCGHKYCQSCIQNYINFSIQNGKVFII